MARPATFQLTLKLARATSASARSVITWDIVDNVVITANGVDVTPIKPNDDDMVIDIPLTQIYEKHTITIFMQDNNYKTLSRTFGVYGKDESLDVTVVNKGEAFAHSRVETMYSPFNNDVILLDLVGNNGTTTWDINGNSFSGTEVTINTSSSFRAVITNTIVQSGVTYTDSTNPFLAGNPLYKWYPAYSTSVITPLLDNECTFLGATNTIYAYADFTAVESFNINGTDSIFPHTLTVLQELIDVDGNVVVDNTSTIDPTPATTLYEPTVWSPTIPTYGDYTVRTTFTISDKDGTDIHRCIKEDRLKTQYWLDIQRSATDCNYIQFNNLGATDAELTVYILEEVNNVKQWVAVPELDAPVLGGQSVSIELKGVYRINVERLDPADVVEFVVVNYCYLQSCLEEVINNVMCGNMKMENLRRILPVMYLHMSELHNEYVNNYYYELPMPSSKIQELWTIKESAERLELYCADCTDYKNGCGC